MEPQFERGLSCQQQQQQLNTVCNHPCQAGNAPGEFWCACVHASSCFDASSSVQLCVADSPVPVCTHGLQEQVGPYVHRVYHQKLDVLWDAEGRVYFKVRPGHAVVC